MVSSSWLVALSSAVAVSSDCKGLGLWLRGLNRTCFCQAAWQGFCFVDVKLLGFEVCGGNWYLLGGMSGRRLAMPRGLPSLLWSTEAKRRKIVVVAGVEEATCSSTPAPSVSQPFPEIASGRSDAPLLRPSTRGDRGVALIKTWTSFHMAWFGPSVEVLPLVPAKVFAVCAMFRAGRYRSVENYLSRIKDLHIGEGFDWSMCLERTFRKSKRAVNRGIGPARQSAALDLVCARGPVGLRNLIVVGCFWMLRELEISCAKVCHLEVDLVHYWVDWTLAVSKTDVRALGKVPRWECVCSGDLTGPCPFHAIVNQLQILRLSHGGELSGSSPLFPTLIGGFVDKQARGGQHGVRRESDR